MKLRSFNRSRRCLILSFLSDYLCKIQHKYHRWEVSTFNSPKNHYILLNYEKQINLWRSRRNSYGCFFLHCVWYLENWIKICLCIQLKFGLNFSRNYESQQENPPGSTQKTSLWQKQLKVTVSVIRRQRFFPLQRNTSMLAAHIVTKSKLFSLLMQMSRARRREKGLTVDVW